MERGCPLCPNVNKWPKGNDCHSLKCCYFSALHFKEGMKLDERGIMRDKKGVVAFVPFCVPFFESWDVRKCWGRIRSFWAMNTYSEMRTTRVNYCCYYYHQKYFLIFKVVYFSSVRKSCA